MDIALPLSGLRPIILSNFLTKIIYQLVHDRIEGYLPKFILQNQYGFVKRRNITENVLIAQEIIYNIKLKGRLDNVVIKLDMTKTY